MEIKFTTKIEEFIAHQDIKFSYGKKRLGNELFVQNVDLLLEQGLSDVEIKVQVWEESKCFFAVSENSDIPFDIFAASFYMLARYEEYLPHVKDDFGRFPASESLAFKEDFLKSPVVDIWAYKFKRLLDSRFSQVNFKTRTFDTTCIITVSHVFNYKNKGFLRTIVGIMADAFNLKFSRISDRLKVLLRLKKDPYNVFDELIYFIKTYKTKMVFMFQLSDYNAYDKNISHNRLNYISIIKYVADYSKVGLRLGYFAIREQDVLKREKKRFESIIHGPLQNVINTKYNLMLPVHYGHLNELDIPNDYSMGYPESIGFRAGSSTSYLFYDINMEVTTPLVVHPYVFHSQVCHSTPRQEVENSLAGVITELKKVNGIFRGVFKNRNFSEYSDASYYYSILKQINEIH